MCASFYHSHQHKYTLTRTLSYSVNGCLHSPLSCIYQQRVALFSTKTLRNGFLCKLALMVLDTQECGRSNRGQKLRRNAELKTNMTLQLQRHYSRAAKRVKNDLRVFTDSTQASGSLFEFNECVSARGRVARTHSPNGTH